MDDIFHTYKAKFLPEKSLRVECPSCGWKGPEFLPNADRRNARCPNCDSKERHRLYYLYLREYLPTDRPLKVLHFAPEKIITRVFKSFRNVDYVSADLNPEKAMIKEDITKISFPDNSFDVIFCSHVLEHIPDDLKAMGELYRVLKPGGLAILAVPIKDVFNGKIITSTFEDFTITDPKEREKVFGQHDHVRIYGRDFEARLEKAGFKVRIDDYAKKLGSTKVQKFALMTEDPTGNETDGWIFNCTK